MTDNTADDIETRQPNGKTPSAGPLVSGQELWKSLGYRTAGAFAQAAHRGTTPIPVFRLPRRQGRYALRVDLERWLAGLPALAKQATSDDSAA